MHITYRQTCRVCGSRHLVPVIDLGDQFLQGSFDKPGHPAPPMRRLPTRLVRCDVTQNEQGCGLLQMAHTMPPVILYSNYWYTSGTNATMREHLQGIVTAALSVTGLTAGNALDIGCNDGTLLNGYPDNFLRMGVDPSDIGRGAGERFEVVNALFPSPAFDAAAQGRSFDVITSIAMFYDLEDPIGFARSIKSYLADKGIWILEMSYLPLMLLGNSFDTICHEHLEYYSLATLEYIMRKAGLRIFKVELNGINGGSIRCYVNHADNFTYDRPEWGAVIRQLRVREFEIELDTDRPYQAFQHRIESLRSELVRLLHRLSAQGKTVHIYGASTKGNTILQWCGLNNQLIACASDRNPSKKGARTLGTNIPIVDEETSRTAKPDYYLVLPWHFKREFIQREAEMLRSGTQMIFPLPRVTIVNATNMGQEMARAEEEEHQWEDILDNPSFRNDILGLL